MRKQPHHGGADFLKDYTLVWVTLWIWHHKYIYQLKQTVLWAFTPLPYILEYINSMKHICQFCTNREAGIIILTRKGIYFLKERDTTLLWSIDYIVWQPGCIAWWIVSHYISSLGLSELLVITQTWAAHCWAPNNGRQALDSKCREN